MDKKPRILIVEDERIIALEMRHKLESMGYDISAIASSGEEAIKKSKELRPDLVLMDIILQGEMDGVEAAGQIRTRFDIPVVYITANVNDARLEDITRSEPFGCLFKPFEDMELHAAIEMALYRYKMEKKLRDSEENYRLIFGNVPLGILYFNEKGIITVCNDQFVKIIGSTREVLVGLNMLNLPDKDIVSTVAMALDGKPGYYEDDYHSVTANKVTPTRILFAPVTSENGKAIGGVGIVEDITERKNAEEELAHRIELERIIQELSMHFVGCAPEDFDSIIDSGLAQLGEFLDIDRVYAFQHDLDKKTMSNTHEWC